MQCQKAKPLLPSRGKFELELLYVLVTEKVNMMTFAYVRLGRSAKKHQAAIGEIPEPLPRLTDSFNDPGLRFTSALNAAV